MNQQKSVKYYFEDQIRRFSVDIPDGPGVFVNLTNKIVSIYPDVPIDELQLCWKDTENELISVGGDEDIKEALKDPSNAEVLRIFGNLKTKSPGFGHAPLHRHRRHGGPFARGGPGFSLRHFPGMGPPPMGPPSMDAPTIDPPTSAAPPSQPQSPPEDPTLHKGVTCDGCEQPVKNRRYKCAVCPDYDLCEACEVAHKHDQHSMVRISDPKDETWRRLFMGRHGCPFRGPRPPHPGPPFFGGNMPQPPPFGPEFFTQFAQAMQPPTNGPATPSAQQPNSNAPTQFLKNVGENIAAILSNFGIDVDVDVEHNGQREKVASEKSTQPQPTTQSTEPVAVSPTMPSAPTPMETVVPDQNTTVTNTSPAPEHNWTFVDRSEVSYPSVQAVTAQTTIDPKIASALALMTSMGFTNEDGWLVRLIESKGGDINAVLDTLNPARRN